MQHFSALSGAYQQGALRLINTSGCCVGLSSVEERRLCLRPISVEILLLGSGAYHLEFLVFVEIEQVDLAKGVEIVARAWENSIDGVLDLDAGHEGAPSLAPPALRWTP